MNKVNLIIRTLAGALLAAAAAGSFAQTLTASRSTSFEYSATTGLMTTEVVEPADPNLCVRTEYALDAYGNRQASTVKNCSGASGKAVFTARGTSATYAAQNVTVSQVTYQVQAGAFATTITNAKNQSETREYDPRFGAVFTQTGPNGLTTRSEYDDFGRKVLEIAPDGNRVAIRYCVIGGTTNDSGNSAGCTTPANAPSSAFSYVETQPQDSNGVASGPYGRKYSDMLGRVIREETQGYDGAGQPAGARAIVKDTEYNPYGAVAKVTQPYFVASGSSLSTGGTAAGWTATVYDAVGRPTAVYTRDNEGSDSYLGAAVAKATVTYNGLVITQKSYRTSKNAQGQQQAYDTLTVVKTSNALGQLMEVKDSLNGTLRKRYDPFGNNIETQDAYDNRIATTFDTRGRKKQMADPNAGTWNYDYDALGQLVFQQSPLQSTSTATTLSYDVLGRVTGRKEPEYSTSWTYDTCTKGVGKLCQVSTTNGQTKSVAYDSYGRPSSSTQAIASGPTFTAGTTYDSKGRVAGYTYPTGIVLTYSYTTLGYLNQITRSGGTRVWAMGSANAWGKAESFDLGTDAKQNSRQTYDAITGRIAGIAAGDMAATVKDAVLSQTYGWDTVGNLTDRSERYSTSGTSILTENFGYDPLNRLASYQTASPNLSPSISKTVTLTYDLIGNITGKSDVGAYTYLASGPSSMRPGAVQSVSGGTVGSRSYTYDNAGNMTAATGSKFTSLTYTSFNLPNTLNGAASNYAWVYGADHERVKETKTWSSNTRTTWYFHPDNANGLAFEQEVKNGNTPIYRHYVTAMGRTVLVIDTQGTTVVGSTSVKELQYWHVDQLGSISTITDQGGSVKQRFSYDPFGKRRDPNGTYDAAGNLVFDFDVNNKTDRGFTGHEHLDDDGIINMNGRTYDPLIGRFMQADPMIQDADELQNYNRYSYVENNPLNRTDPTGHFSLRRFLKANLKFGINPSPRNAFELFRNQPGQEYVDRFIMKNPIAYQIGQMVATYFTAFCGGCGGALWSSYYTYLGTGSMTAAYRAGGEAMAISYAFSYVGKNFAAGSFGNYAGHALIGCAAGAAHGGGGEGCARGAVSSFASKWATNSTDGWADPQKFVATVVAGGTVSVIGGGKFANGAFMAAFGFLRNYCDTATVACFKAWGTNLGKIGLGTFGAVAGGGLCTTGLGCALGSIGVVTGLSNVKEGADWIANGSETVDGKNPIKEAIVRTVPSANADLAYASLEVLGGGMALKAPVILTHELWITHWGIQTATGLPIVRQASTLPSGAFDAAGAAWDGSNAAVDQATKKK